MIPKFRVWCKNRNEWEKDICFVSQDGMLYQRYTSSPVPMPILERNHDVMQSTNLRDKNDVEVFEGDIVKCTRGCPHEIIRLEEYGGTFLGGMPAWYLSGLKEGYAWTGEEEIIGNIYENPELLEVPK